LSKKLNYEKAAVEARNDGESGKKVTERADAVVKEKELSALDTDEADALLLEEARAQSAARAKFADDEREYLARAARAAEAMSAANSMRYKD
jgi:hypothetical protein